MQLQPLSFKPFDSSVVEHAARRQFMPPSFLPEPEAPAPVILEPTYSEEDVKRAEQEGYRRGFLEGSEDAKKQAASEQAELQSRLEEAMQGASGEMQKLFADYQAQVNAQLAELPRLALAIARKVAGDALSENAGGKVEAMIMETLPRVMGAPSIHVTVHESLAEKMETMLIRHFEGNADPGEISVQGDASFAPADLRIDWGAGQAEHREADLWRDIESVIDAMVRAPQQETTPAQDITPAQEP